MPTETGRFTDQELTKIHTLMDQKKIDPDAACPNCSNKDWLLFPFEARIPSSSLDRYMPMVTLICTNCGYSKLFNLIVSGIVEREGNSDGSA